jgi:hypothetical protein
MRLIVSVLLLLFLAGAPAAQSGTYFPPAGTWAKKAPAELGLDPAKLAEAVTYAQSRETNRAIDFSDQEKTFGSLLGSLPTKRARTARRAPGATRSSSRPSTTSSSSGAGTPATKRNSPSA